MGFRFGYFRNRIGAFKFAFVVCYTIDKNNHSRHNIPIRIMLRVLESNRICINFVLRRSRRRKIPSIATCMSSVHNFDRDVMA